MPETDPESAPPKEFKLQIRMDDDLARQAMKKALRYGGLSAVVRALIRRWVEDDIISDDDIIRENIRAPKPQPRPRRRSK